MIPVSPSVAVLGAAITLALAILISKFAGRRWTAAQHHLVLVSGFAVAMALPFVQFAFLKTPAVQHIRSGIVITVTPNGLPVPAHTEADWNLVQAVWIVWCAASVILLLRLGWFACIRARTGNADYAAAIGSEMAADLRIRQRVRFSESPEFSIPGTCGLLRPRIVMPVVARLWPADRLRAVLLHELMHVRRHDWLWTLLAETVAAMHWFNPLAWYAARLLRRYRELACDDAVLSYGFDGPDYANHLIAIARTRDLRGSTALVTMAQVSGLETRIRSILNPNVKRGGVPMKGKLAASFFAAITLAGLAGLQAPAQNSGAGLFGTVQDASGGYIVNAVVLVRNINNNKRDITRTDDAGEFRFLMLPPGRYRVEVTKPGFQFHRQEGVTVQPGASEKLPVTLNVGSINEVINVAGTRTSAVAPVAQTPTRLRIGGNVQAAKLVKSVRPIYPASMKQQGIQGSVIIDAVIGLDGRIINLNAANSLVHQDLIDAALEAVRQWEYEPTLLNGSPVEVATVINVNFTLLP